MDNQINVTKLKSNRENDKKWKDVLFSPLTRILIAIVFISPVILFNNAVTEVITKPGSDLLVSSLQIVKTILILFLLFAMYRLYTRLIEKRACHEFSRKKALREILLGLGIGGGMVVLITLILIISGFYEVDHLNSPGLLITRIFRYSQGAFIEELIFTLIIFRLAEEFSGTVIAYVFVSLVFGGMHLMNDNATLVTSLCISVQQITLLAPFILTRRIWMGWAVHLNWNFSQAGVFGMNNSGMDHGGFISPLINGPNWITGGDFGIEASLLSLLINLCVGIVLFRMAIKHKQILRIPFLNTNK